MNAFWNLSKPICIFQKSDYTSKRYKNLKPYTALNKMKIDKSAYPLSKYSDPADPSTNCIYFQNNTVICIIGSNKKEN